MSKNLLDLGNRTFHHQTWTAISRKRIFTIPIGTQLLQYWHCQEDIYYNYTLHYIVHEHTKDYIINP